MLVRVWRMRSGISITVDRTARLRLEGVVIDDSSVQASRMQFVGACLEERRELH